MAIAGQELVTRVGEDLELLAQQVVTLRGEFADRLEGVQAGFEAALLHQEVLYTKRFERLEALLAAAVGPAIAEELLAELAR